MTPTILSYIHFHFCCTICDHNSPTLQTDGRHARSISTTCYVACVAQKLYRMSIVKCRTLQFGSRLKYIRYDLGSNVRLIGLYSHTITIIKRLSHISLRDKFNNAGGISVSALYTGLDRYNHTH